MLGINYIKVSPTSYVLQLKDNKVVREGAGLSFYYFAPTSNIIRIPINSTELPFIYKEVTKDYQPVSLQGQLTYVIKEPTSLSKLLDFSINHTGRYLSDDPHKLNERLTRLAEVISKEIITTMDLRETLVSHSKISKYVFEKLNNSASIKRHGIEILDFAISNISPTPEMTKAIEAGSREELKKEADEAIYDRRNSSIEQERIIKENELQTEIAAEEKNREIQEKKLETEMASQIKKQEILQAKLNAEIVIEEKRKQLIEKKIENDNKVADSRAYSLHAVIKPIEKLDWKTLMTIMPNGGDPAMLISSAFNEMAINAEKIGELNINPDLLNGLLRKKA